MRSRGWRDVINRLAPQADRRKMVAANIGDVGAIRGASIAREPVGAPHFELLRGDGSATNSPL
jgi:hypothetical protein